jgi:probable rRNA maturation factor
VKAFARTLQDRVAGGAAFTCLISDDGELRTLNRTFLNHDYATDVLSFPAGQPSAHLGEIALSVERAAAQAAEFGHSRLQEIHILMLHGVLHLTGMDHEQDEGEMAAAEARWRLDLQLPATLIERVSGMEARS